MPFAEISTGARLYYDDIGQGEPLIVVHGRLGTAQLDFGRILEWLSPDYHIWGPTLRGYGESTPKPRDFPLDFYHRDAADVLAFMDAVGLKQAHIMGYSDGGEVALIAAGTQPERFKSVIVWGAVGYFGPAMRPVVQRNYPPTWMTEQDKAIHSITDPDRFALAWIKAMKHMIDSGGDVSLSLADKIACPVLMMLGDQDHLNPEEYGRNFINKTRSGRLEMFHCGHGIQDEDWDNFQRVVGAFLQSVK
jgi:valacyclovir hydrolase